MRTTYSILGLLGLCLLFVASGCRTYGGYGTEEQTYEEMTEAVEELEADLQAAKSDLKQLRAAAEQRAALVPLADRYQTLVSSHESMIDAQRQKVESLSAEASYRTLHRTYGAFDTDQRLLRRQYERTVRQVYAVVRDTTPPVPPVRDPSTYSITPVNYPRPHREITMVEALRPVEGVPGLQAPGEQP